MRVPAAVCLGIERSAVISATRLAHQRTLLALFFALALAHPAARASSTTAAASQTTAAGRQATTMAATAAPATTTAAATAAPATATTAAAKAPATATTAAATAPAAATTAAATATAPPGRNRTGNRTGNRTDRGAGAIGGVRCQQGWTLTNGRCAPVELRWIDADVSTYYALLSVERTPPPSQAASGGAAEPSIQSPCLHSIARHPARHPACLTPPIADSPRVVPLASHTGRRGA